MSTEDLEKHFKIFVKHFKINFARRLKRILKITTRRISKKSIERIRTRPYITMINFLDFFLSLIRKLSDEPSSITFINFYRSLPTNYVTVEEDVNIKFCQNKSMDGLNFKLEEESLVLYKIKDLREVEFWSEINFYIQFRHIRHCSKKTSTLGKK